MTTRLNPFASGLGLVQPLIDFGTLSQEGIDPILAELVRIRASQINGCAACLWFHRAEALKHGETEERMLLVSGWRESPLFTARERAALEWAETLTHVADQRPSDQAYDGLRKHFSDDEITRITLLIAAVNAFNRVNLGFNVQHPVALARKSA